MLEDVRLRKGITLDKVEDDLKIRKHYILAMEAGRWEELPGYAYATGFLRTYGEYLGLSGDDLVQEYKYWREIRGIDTIAEETPVGVFTRAKELQTDTGIFQLGKDQGGIRRRRKAKRGLVVILILVVALAAYAFLTWKQPFLDREGFLTPGEQVGNDGYWDSAETETTAEEAGAIPEGLGGSSEVEMDKKEPMVETPVEDKAQDLASDLAEITSQDDQMERLSTEAQSVERPPELAVESQPAGIIDESEPEQPVTESEFQELETATSEVEVTMPEDVVHRLPPVEVGDEVWPLTVEAIVTGRCWVEVRGDGRVLASRTLEPGEQHTWNAMEEIRIRFGNAGAVQLKLNGQDLGPAGKGVVTRVFTSDTHLGD